MGHTMPAPHLGLLFGEIMDILGIITENRLRPSIEQFRLLSITPMPDNLDASRANSSTSSR